MNIYIKYQNKKILVKPKTYESIYSIISNFVKDDIKSYNIFYKNKILDTSYSLEKYDVTENSILVLDKKLKGGNDFMTFAKNNYYTVIIVFIICLLPILILPLGFFPALSSLIGVITVKSTKAFGHYLMCSLGKITLYKRLSYFIWLLKYPVFFLMIFAIITFPLILLAITLKGHTIMDNPKSLCSAITIGNTSGLIVTMIYILIYGIYRGFDFVLKPILYFCKQVYILNLLFVPLLNAFLRIFDNIKYVVFYMIPVLGPGIAAYFKGLDLLLPGFETILGTAVDLGCSANISFDTFSKKMISKINSKEIQEQLQNISKSTENGYNIDFINNNNERYGNIFAKDIPECVVSPIECCNPKKFIMIADLMYKFITNSISSKILKETGLMGTFALAAEGLYDSAISILDGKETKDNKNDYEEESIKQKIASIDAFMVDYSNKNGSKYIPGKSLMKTILKIVFVDIMCNTFETARTSENVIAEMGSVVEIADMLKSGTCAGLITVFSYIIAIIIIIICIVFDFF
jgi:hypothetical protein